MQGFIDYIKGMLGDHAGLPSTKRVITVLFAALIMVAFVANLFWGYHVDDKLVDSVMMVVIAGFGFTGVEKFAPKSGDGTE